MMKDLQVFDHAQFGQIRTILLGGQLWFVAADICNALDIANPTDAIKRLDEDERARFNLGRQGETNIVNEPGLYALILGSRKPEAKAFKRWITHEVIPAIREHGGYLTPAKVEEVLSDPDTLIRLATQLKESRQQILSLEAANAQLAAENQAMLPKAEYFDELVSRNSLTSFRDTAKAFGVKERKFVSFLIDKGYVYRDKKKQLMPCAGKGDGLFEIRETISEKTNWAGMQTLITPMGRKTFRLLLENRVVEGA